MGQDERVGQADTWFRECAVDDPEEYSPSCFEDSCVAQR